MPKNKLHQSEMPHTLEKHNLQNQNQNRYLVKRPIPEDQRNAARSLKRQKARQNKPRQRGKWCKTTKRCVKLSPKCLGSRRGKRENCEREGKKDVYDIFSERPIARRDISLWMSPEQQHSVSKIWNHCMQKTRKHGVHRDKNGRDFKKRIIGA